MALRAAFTSDAQFDYVTYTPLTKPLIRDNWSGIGKARVLALVVRLSNSVCSAAGHGQIVLHHSASLVGPAQRRRSGVHHFHSAAAERQLQLPQRCSAAHEHLVPPGGLLPVPVRPDPGHLLSHHGGRASDCFSVALGKPPPGELDLWLFGKCDRVPCLQSLFFTSIDKSVSVSGTQANQRPIFLQVLLTV